MSNYRITKKKIKKLAQVRLFIKSNAEWIKVWADSIASGDLNRAGIAHQFVNYTWKQVLDIARQNRIKSKQLKIYSYKTFGI